jgi:ABC-type transporter Mla subunit MlaD
VPRRKLRETLEELEHELERAEAIDDRAREQLDHVVREVGELLDRTQEASEDQQSLLDRLAQATRDFEKSHPALAETVGRLAAALSNLGI